MTPSQQVKSGEVELAVYTWGKAAPGKPTIVLVHGYPDAASVWKATAEKLAEKYFVVAYDVRGAGRSSRPDHTRAYDLGHLVSDLAAVVDAVSPDKPIHLVGHDWGSIQSWEAVTTERLKGRILSYTSISGPSLDHAGYWIAQRLKSGAPGKLAEVARQVAHSWYVGAFHLPVLGPTAWKVGLDKLWPLLLEKVEGIREVEANATQKMDGAVGVNLYRANFTKRLLNPQERRTDIPVQLVFPRGDKFMVPEIWDDLPQWAPNLWRSDVDAGHWLQVSHPELVAHKVSEFVDFVQGGPESLALKRARRTARSQGKRYAGKLAVVTGAGSGIGRETVLAYAESGADVVAVDINLAAAERTAELARLMGVEAFARQVDVGSTEQMEALASWVETELGAPDVIVNNAGIGMSGAMLDTTTADWDKIIKVNLWSVIHGSRLFGQQMVKAGKKGHIVNVSSGLAFLPTRLTPAYNTTKAAVQMLSECLRAELASQGIGVSAVYPGVVNTGIVGNTQFVGKDSKGQQRERDRANRLYQLRNLKPDAVAKAILDAVDHNRPEVRVGVEVHAIRYLSRFAPGIARRLAQLNPT